MKGKRLLVLLAVIGVFAAVLTVSVLGGGPEEPLPGFPLGAIEKPLLLGQGEAGPYFVSGQTVLSLDTAAGQLLQVDPGVPVLGAACRGGRVVLFTAIDDFLLGTVVYGPGLAFLGQYESDLLPEDPILYDCTADGSLYAVCDGDESVLEFHTTDGKTQKLTFPSPIRLLQVTEEGQLWVATAEGYWAGDAENPNSLRPIAGGAPQRVLCQNVFSDERGDVWRITGESAELAKEGVPSLCAADGTGLVYAEGSYIHRFLWDGGEAGSCLVDGEPAALTAQGVLYQKDGEFFYALLDFTPPEPPPPPSEPESSSELEPGPSIEPSVEPSIEPSFEPSIEPSVSPSHKPDEMPEWCEFRGHYLYVTGEKPLEELRKLIWLEGASFESPSGEAVTKGNLFTGLIVRGWDPYETGEDVQIIVRGDVDGDGRIKKADMERAQRLLLAGREDMEEWSFLAADWDEDGEITTRDLLRLSAELEKYK